MTGDWASSVQILRLVVDCEVPVVVLNIINNIVKIFDDVDSVLPGTSDVSSDRKDSPTPCQLGE